MARGIDKSRLARYRKNRSGYSLSPKYYKKPNEPTERQIVFMKDLYKKLNICGIELQYDKRALVNGRITSAEIRRAFVTADKNGINLKEVS